MVVVIVKLFKIELKGYTALWFGESVCGRTLLKLFSAFRGFSLLSFYTTITFVKAFFYFRSWCHFNRVSLQYKYKNYMYCKLSRSFRFPYLLFWKLHHHQSEIWDITWCKQDVWVCKPSAAICITKIIWTWSIFILLLCHQL